MRFKKGIFFSSVLIFLFVAPGVLSSQVPVEPSKEKVIISGVPYYIHQVKKGQTAYSISKAYGITVGELTAENPPAVYGLKEGQTLRIPFNQNGNQKNTAPTPFSAIKKDESKFYYHSLKSGETVYSLSKLYGVSENDIIQGNPGMDINKLPVGSEIAVPKKEFQTQKQKFVDQDQKYIYHRVQKGETLASIAEKYGVTVRVLRKENRNVRFPRVGDYIRIPGQAKTEEAPRPVLTDSLPDMAEEEVVKLTKPSGYTPVTKLQGSLNVAVLLPFYLDRNSKRVAPDSAVVKGKKQYRMLTRPEDWIDPQSLDFVEMYNGILLAADTLRSLGLNINLHTWDIKGDTVGITNLINSGKLSGMDMIIGPVYSHNLSIVSRFAKKSGIPVVSPVELMNNSPLTGNPTLFMACPTLEVIQKGLSKKISEDNNANLVFIHTDSTRTDPDVKRFKSLIFNELNSKMPYEDIRFREFVFYSRFSSGKDSINRLSHSLSENSDNIIIIASDDPPAVSEIMTIIHGLSKRFNIRVYGYPSIVQLDNLDPRVFFDLNLLVFSPTWIDHSRENVRRFDLNYMKKFLTMPMENSFAWIGYDIIYFFASGLSMDGKDFIVHPEMHNPALLQDDFDFERKSMNDGFENQKLFKYRYTKDYELKPEE